MLKAELDKRFTHHPPGTPEVISRHEQLRATGRAMAEQICNLVPDGRERALALANLEQVVMWGNAGIARDPAAPIDGVQDTTDVKASVGAAGGDGGVDEDGEGTS